MVPPLVARWEFVRASADSWQWNHFDADGSVESASEPQSGFGPALGDAVRHGFNPSRDYWVVIDEMSITWYPPAASPHSTS